MNSVFGTVQKKSTKKLPPIVKLVRDYSPDSINYSFQKNISYSQISLYNECPKKWSLYYKEGYKPFTSNIHTVFGTAIHQTLQYYLEVMYDQSGTAADRLDLDTFFENSLREEYLKQYNKNKQRNFVEPNELEEAFEDGIKIIEAFKKKKGKYFSKRGWYLVKCELPLILAPYKRYNNVLFEGHIDVVMYHEPTNTWKLIDIKTSTRSWNDKQKKDKNKQNQLILYKKFFSEQFNIPIDNIEVEFFIVKRKLYENIDYPQSRIQTVTPPSGKTSINRAWKVLEGFITKAFENGDYNDNDLQPTASKDACFFCPFKSNKVLCPKGIE